MAVSHEVIPTTYLETRKRLANSTVAYDHNRYPMTTHNKSVISECIGQMGLKSSYTAHIWRKRCARLNNYGTLAAKDFFVIA